MKKILLAVLAIIIFTVPAFAADVHLKWDSAQGATSYKLYMSTDNGGTWLPPVDVGNVTEYTYTGVPDHGTVLFYAAACNEFGETRQTGWGVWFNGDWLPPLATQGLTIP